MIKVIGLVRVHVRFKVVFRFKVRVRRFEPEIA